MKDLEIRGAGNLLGGEQSGHIAGVGFDLYVRLVGEAVAEFRGERRRGAAEVKVELPVDAHLPHDYVPGERLRLEAYRKIAEVVGRGGPRRRSARSCSTATARCRSRSRTCSPSPGSGSRARRAGLTEITAAGQPRPVRPGRPARLGADAAEAALPGLAGQARGRARCSCRGRRRPGSAGSRCATGDPALGGGRRSPRCSAASVAAAAAVAHGPAGAAVRSARRQRPRASLRPPHLAGGRSP